MNTQLNFNFSPSLYHQQLMQGIVPSLSYHDGDVTAWQNNLRNKVSELLGFDFQHGNRVPLNAHILWRRNHEYGIIENIVFTSEDMVDVPAYLCIPSEAVAPYTCFICLQGHTSGMHNSIGVDFTDESTPIDTDGDRDFGIGCMRRGIMALCIEQRSFGERQEKHQPQHLDYLCHQAAMNALLIGRTLLGERIFDIDRAIDYLSERGDIDMARIGVMGNSGGGTTTLFSAALLPRVRFAMPSCCFSTFQASIQSMLHCVCNYVPGLLQYADMGDIAGLIAPKPLIIVSGDEDGIFPINEARTEFARVKNIYESADAANDCHHVVCHGGHQFYADAAWQCFLEKYK
ncbi:MAG: alpha/beta hydrolase family protein [bacterium]